MASERKNITQPEHYWPEFQLAAKAEGVSLSEWIGECGLANLTNEAQARIAAHGERQGAGRPRKERTDVVN